MLKLRCTDLFVDNIKIFFSHSSYLYHRIINVNLLLTKAHKTYRIKA